MTFDGKVCAVTGAGGGIGRACVELLAKNGARVIALDINGAAVQNVADSLSGQGFLVEPFAADIRDSERICSIMDDVAARFGNIDVLINNAGGPSDWIDPVKYPRARFIDTREDAWRNTIEVNLMGTMIVTHAVLKHMIAAKRGSIVNIGSVAGVNGLAAMADYSAAKGGVIAFTKALAVEVGRLGVRVNCVSPGSILKNGSAPNTFLGRAGLPADAANLSVFLASDDSDFITGQNYVIDGGRTLSMKCD